MKKITGIILGMAVLTATLLCSCNKSESEIKDFVQKFAQSVQDGNFNEITSAYPSANEIDSLSIEFVAESMKIVEDKNSGTFLVQLNDDQDLSISRAENGSMQITQSHGLAAYDKSLLDFAHKTGQYKTDLDDVENAMRMKDTGFKSWLISSFAKEVKDKLKIKGGLKVLKESETTYEMDGIVAATIENSNNFTVNGQDYKVIFDGGLQVQGVFNKESTTEAGKDINAGKSVTIKTRFNCWHYRDKAKIHLKINDEQVFNKYFIPTGDEYEKYLSQK